MCSGSLLRGMIAFAVPIILTGILQLLYSAADQIVVGQFAENKNAFAAVGATSSLTSAFVNIFVGISGGGCICVAQYYGARDGKNVSETVHTCVLISLICGVVVAIIGFIFCKPVLVMMGTPEDILDLSTMYMRIMFVCQPFSLFYNFASGILRATGDTKRPFYIMVFTGALNVVLNLIFVICFKMDVDGVGYATLIGAILNALIAARILTTSDDSIRVNIKDLKIHWDKVGKIMSYGLASGLQSFLFSISNVIIQSSVNTLANLESGVLVGSTYVKGVSVVGGNSASSSIEGFIYMSMNAIAQAQLNFTGANLGARNYKRVDKSLLTGLGIVTVVGGLMGAAALLFKVPLLSIYQPKDADAVLYGTTRLMIVGSTYFICGIHDVMISALRGIGSSWAPTIISVASVGGVRVMWLLFVFPHFLTPLMLYVAWPLTWISALVLLVISYLTTKKKYFAKNEAQYTTVADA